MVIVNKDEIQNTTRHVYKAVAGTTYYIFNEDRFYKIASHIFLLSRHSNTWLPSSHLQGTFRMYPLSSEEPDDPPLILSGYPTSDLQEVVVRVYVVLGQDLAPKDAGCSSDPYVVVKLGKNTKSSKDDYQPNTLNPIFGQ